MSWQNSYGSKNSISNAPFLLPEGADLTSLLSSIRVGGLALLVDAEVENAGRVDVIKKKSLRQVWTNSATNISTDGNERVFEDENIDIRILEGERNKPTIELGIRTAYGIDVYRYNLAKSNPSANPAGSAFLKNNQWMLGNLVFNLEHQYTEFNESDDALDRFVDSVVHHEVHRRPPTNEDPADMEAVRNHVRKGALLSLDNEGGKSLRFILEEANTLTPKLMLPFMGTTARGHHILSSDFLRMIADLRDVDGINTVIREAVNGTEEDSFANPQLSYHNDPSSWGINGYTAHLIAAHSFYDHGFDVEGFGLRSFNSTGSTSKKNEPKRAHVVVKHEGNRIPLHVRRIIAGDPTWLLEDIAKQIKAWPNDQYKAVVVVHELNSFSLSSNLVMRIGNRDQTTSIFGVGARDGKASKVFGSDNFPGAKLLDNDSGRSRFRRSKSYRRD